MEWTTPMIVLVALGACITLLVIGLVLLASWYVCRLTHTSLERLQKMEALVLGMDALQSTMQAVHHIVNSRTDRMEAELRELRGKLDQASALALHTEALRTAMAGETSRLVLKLKETMGVEAGESTQEAVGHDTTATPR